jgi:hypothetical protein
MKLSLPNTNGWEIFAKPYKAKSFIYEKYKRERERERQRVRVREREREESQRQREREREKKRDALIVHCYFLEYTVELSSFDFFSNYSITG